MIVEKIMQNYSRNSSILFCKDTPQIFYTSIPTYPEDTELELGIDNLYHVVNDDIYSQELDAFYSEVHYEIPIQKVNALFSSAKEMGIHVYTLYKMNPYHLYQLKQRDLSDILSIEDITRITNPTTFKGKHEEIVYLTKYILEKLRQNTGSTLFWFDTIYKLVNKRLKANQKGITIQEFIAHINARPESFYINRERFTLHSPIALFSDYNHEVDIYNKVKRYLDRPTPFPNYQFVSDSYLAEEQNEAASRLIVESGLLSILAGGPGTGKTTILKKIVLEMQKTYPEEEIALLSPTGKAAKRIAEVMDGLDLNIQTIHKFLGYKKDGTLEMTPKKREEVSKTHLVIIDESSMLGSSLFYDLIKHLDLAKTKIILVGDIDQLPSIDAGALLRDLMDLGVFTIVLRNNFRSEGNIIENSRKIKDGKDDLIFDDSFVLTDECVTNIMEDVKDLEKDFIILSPFHNYKISNSTDQINEYIHTNGYQYGNAGLKYRPMEKVIVTKTVYDNKKPKYINGDVGYIIKSELIIKDNEDLSDIHEETKAFCYDVKLGDEVVSIPEEHLDYGYALPIHKSQGSEYDVVHIVLLQYSNFITRKMLYTAITRARHQVVIHSTLNILKQIIKNNQDSTRNTVLQYLIYSAIS